MGSKGSGRSVFFPLVSAVILVGLCCSKPSLAQQSPGNWAWMGGHNVGCPLSGCPWIPTGVYGTEYQFAAQNDPGLRKNASTWNDAEGRLWMFGGAGYDSETSGYGLLNDLWVFDAAEGAHGQWAWMGGDTTLLTRSTGRPGVYGTEYQFGAGNKPGGRESAASAIDAQGRLWLFGGRGYDSGGTFGYLSDLWVFDPAQGTNGEWAWMGGNSVLPSCEETTYPCALAAGSYGTEWVFAAGNHPGGRTAVAAWFDKSGRLWIFGGIGWESTGYQAKLNDLWVFDPAQGAHGEWAWMGGSAVGNPGPSTYGSEYEFAPGNSPTYRDGPFTWKDGKGDLWLFGGYGMYPEAELYMNDLWEFDPTQGAHGEWAWMGGNDHRVMCSEYLQCGVYGQKYTFGPANLPGGRQDGASWTDSSGRLWLFGGTATARSGLVGSMNDLWVFDPAQGAHGEWAWMSGGSTLHCDTNWGCPGPVFGTEYLFGIANVPEQRATSTYGQSGVISWTDKNGNLWLGGGHQYDASTSTLIDQDFDTLWKFHFGLAGQIIYFLPLPSPVTYGVAPIKLSATSSSTLPVTFTVAGGPATVSGTNDSILTISGAGIVSIGAHQVGNGAYSPAPRVLQNITVSKAPLQVVADNKIMKAGGPMANLTWHPSGFVNGDKIPTALTGWPALSTTATTASPPGTYPITVGLGTLGAKNYAFQFVAGTLTIKP